MSENGIIRPGMQVDTSRADIEKKLLATKESDRCGPRFDEKITAEMDNVGYVKEKDGNKESYGTLELEDKSDKGKKEPDRIDNVPDVDAEIQTGDVILDPAGRTLNGDVIKERRFSMGVGGQPMLIDLKAVESSNYLVYNVSDSPPVHVTIICALQQGLLSISAQLVTALLVADAVCASNDDVVKARILSSTFMMTGLTTVLMNLFGLRLPLFQGASGAYIIPLLLMGKADSTFCTSESSVPTFNSSANATLIQQAKQESTELIYENLRKLQGSLMIVAAVHTVAGMTGLVGVTLRFIGPITIVPTLTLIFIFIVKPVLKYIQVNWGIALLTVAVSVLLSVYLAKYKMPIPVWTPKKGCRIIWYPLHQVFAILIAILVNWGLCAILTVTGSLTDDPNAIGYRTRTDARAGIIADSPWVIFPYPGQWGSPIGFSDTAIVSMFIATLLSIIDSIGDYYACARVCRVPAPPVHAVNRGIVIEGLCGMLSGALGTGHATNSYGGNIGAIGATKVASRRVFTCCGIVFILFALFGKFCGVFITIPHPVLGGAMIVLFGMYFGVVISNLEVVNMSAPRNIAILGLSVFIGLLVPTWAQENENPIGTGNVDADRIINIILINPNFVGLVVAFFLDNTVPGTLEERGIAAWTVPKGEAIPEEDRGKYVEGYEVYNPLLPERVLHWKIVKYLPFLPYRGDKSTEHVA